jgi:hypothetical protein
MNSSTHGAISQLRTEQQELNSRTASRGVEIVTSAQHEAQLGAQRWRKSNQQDLMQQMEPQRRLACSFPGTCKRSERLNVELARGLCDDGEVGQQLHARLIELQFLNRQVIAQALAVRMAVARVMVWLAVLLVVTIMVRMMAACVAQMLSRGRFTADRIVLMVPAATDRCMH